MLLSDMLFNVVCERGGGGLFYIFYCIEYLLQRKHLITPILVQYILISPGLFWFPFLPPPPPPPLLAGASVAVKISNPSNPTMTYGRQFDHTGPVYSRISRESIDALKEFFKADVAKEDWQLIVKMKKVFCIM